MRMMKKGGKKDEEVDIKEMKEQREEIKQGRKPERKTYQKVFQQQ